MSAPLCVPNTTNSDALTGTLYTISHLYTEATDGPYIGMCCATALYGILFTLYTQCIATLYARKVKTTWSYLHTAFATILWSIGTLNIISITSAFRPRTTPAMFTLMFGPLDQYRGMSYDTLLPFGPMWPITLTKASVVTFFVAVWLQDGLLLYRCFMTWGRKWMVVILPALLYFASVALSIASLSLTTIIPLQDITTDRLSDSIRNSSTVLFAFWAISIALNLLLTTLIGGRIMYHKHVLGRAISPHHAKVYTSIVTIIVESAAMYTVPAVLYFIAYTALPKSGLRGLYFLQAMQPILSIMEVLAPMLIIHRIAKGKGFSNRSMTTSTAVAPSGSHSHDSNEKYSVKSSVPTTESYQKEDSYDA